MNELINTTKTYCSICDRYLGYMQKDRLTLLAPVTICFACEKAKEEASRRRVTSCIRIGTTVALVVAVTLTVIWALHHYMA